MKCILAFIVSSFMFGPLAWAELDMNGAVLTDKCEKKALEIIQEKSCLNCAPNEPLYRFVSIKRLDLDNDVYGSRLPLGHFYGLFEAVLYGIHDGDMPIERERKFYAVIEYPGDC